jgi:hypothetical protein
MRGKGATCSDISQTLEVKRSRRHLQLKGQRFTITGSSNTHHLRSMFRRPRSYISLVLLLGVFFTALFLLHAPNEQSRDRHSYADAVERAREAVGRFTALEHNVQQSLSGGERHDEKVRDRYGLTILDMTRSKNKHPIAMLIQEARGKHEKMKRRMETQTTLEEAIADYREMTGGVWDPPRGFEEWCVPSTTLPLGPLHSLTTVISRTAGTNLHGLTTPSHSHR